jgi:hypothetical protein
MEFRELSTEARESFTELLESLPEHQKILNLEF